MKLYYAPGTCALAPHITLEWLGVPYRTEIADPSSESFRAINPLGMVPALEPHRGKILTQTEAILTYLADAHPRHGLGAARGTQEACDLNEILSFLTGDFHPAFRPFFAPERFTTAKDDTILMDVRTAALSSIDRVMSFLDAYIGGRQTVLVDKRSIADTYAFAMVRWTAGFSEPWMDYPGLAPFMDAMYRDKGALSAMEQQGILKAPVET